MPPAFVLSQDQTLRCRSCLMLFHFVVTESIAWPIQLAPAGS
jgi:hypothetical protein